MTSIDIDDTGTWPGSVWEHVLDRATHLRGSTRYASDLDVGLDGSATFDNLMSGQLLRAYHCTRLLPHEDERIREVGLRPLGVDLVKTRLDEALAHGALTEEQHEELASHTVFRRRNTNGRLAQVCAVVGRDPFDTDVHGVAPLLGIWGGEAIYWAHDRTPTENVLRDIGTPSIVVIDLDLGATAVGARRHLFFPELEKAFVGKVLGLEGAASSAHYFAAVGPERVVDIWRPGDDEYDRHPTLPG